MSGLSTIASSPASTAACSAPTATATSPDFGPGPAGLPAGKILLSHRPRPFSAKTKALELPAGLTIAEIVHIAQPDPAWSDFTFVRVGDDPEPIPRHLWARIRPKACQRIYVAVLPAGNNVLSTVLMVAVVAVALIAAPYLAPAFMGAGGVAAVGAALSIGGMLAVNALVPPASTAAAAVNAATPTSYSLTGGSNRPRLWGAIPRVLGRHRMAPDVAAPWVTDVEGDRAYLCGLLSFGYGPLAITDIHIGDTPLLEYDEVQTQIVAGHRGERPDLSLYPNVIVPLGVSTRLARSTGWVSRTTAPDTDEAVIELALPSGGFRAGNDPGERVGISVSFEVELEPTGGGTRQRWGSHRIDAKTQATKRSTIRVKFATRGQYLLHVRRTTADADEDDERQRVDESWWIALRSHRNEVPIRRTGLCLMAIRIKATEQLNNTIDNLTAIAASIGPHYDGDVQAWPEQPTSQPSALFRMVLQGNGQKNPIADDRIDWPQLEAWAHYCWEKKLTCNIVLDQGVSTWEALRTVCAVGRAAPTCATGLWSVVVDWPRPYALQQFTPRNSTGFRGRRLFVDLPHALRVRFRDETDNFEDAERIVYDDGYDKDNATRFESIEFPGVTSAAQIHKLARMRIAEARLRAETFELETSWEWLSSTRGDRVGVANDVTEWGNDSFRLKSLVVAGGLLAALVLDGPVALADAQAHDVSIRGVGQEPVVLLGVQGDAAFSDTLALDPPIELPLDIQPGDVVTVGARGIATYDCIIQAITPGRDLSAKLNLIPYHEGVYRADTESIPAWSSGRTRIPGVDQPKIIGVRSGETAGKRNSDGSLLVRVLVSLYDDGSRPLTVVSSVELRWREKDTGGPWLYLSFPADAREIAILEAEDDTTIELAVRYQRRDGRNTLWTSVVNHFVDGPDIPPPDVASLYVDSDRLSWTAPVPLPRDLAGYRLYWNSTEGQPLNAAQLYSEGLTTDTFIALGSVPDSAAEMLVVAVTTSGLQSVNPARVKISPALLPTRIELTRVDLQAGGFKGSLVNCVVEDGELVATDNSLFLAPTTARFLDPPDGLFLAASWSAISYETVYPLSSLAREGDRIRLDLEYEGSIQLFYAWGGEALQQWPKDEPISDALWQYARANSGLVFGQILGDPVEQEGVFAGGVFAGGVFQAETAGAVTAARGLRPWRTSISVRPREVLRVQLRSQGGSGVRPRITRFSLVLEGPEIEETFANLVVAASGTRLPLTRPFRKIQWLTGIPRADGSSQGTSPAFVTKDLPEGPIVIVRNPSGVPVNAVSDWRVGGV